MDDVIVFIDYMYLRAEREFIPSAPRNIDIEKFSDLLVEDLGNHHRLRTYVYTALPYFDYQNPSNDQTQARDAAIGMYEAMEYKKRVTVRLGEISPENEQKEVDTQLTIDMVLLSQRKAMKTAILVAGDGDYVPAVKFAQNAGVTTILYYFRNDTASKKLRRVIDEDRQIDSGLILRSSV